MLNQSELWSMKDRINTVLRELGAGYVAEVVRDARAGVHSFVLSLNSYGMWPRVQSATRQLELAVGRSVTVGRTHGQPVIRVADDTAQQVTLDELLARPPANVRDCAVPLGVAAAGGPLWLEIGSNRNNILICGQPGSGKTWLTHSIITALARRMTPKRLRFVLLDPKHHNLTPLTARISPFVERVEQGYDEIARALSAVAVDVMQARSYERETVVVVDEFLEVLDHCDGAEQALTTIMRSGREYGYRLIACSQAGNIGALAGALSGLWSMRIVGRMDNAKSAYDAAGIRDSGAEKLTGAGDFLAVFDGRAVRFRAPVPPVTYTSTAPGIEPERVLERVMEIAEREAGAGDREAVFQRWLRGDAGNMPTTAPVPVAQSSPMPVSMAIPVDDSRDTTKDAAAFETLRDELGYAPGVTAWAKRRFPQWAMPYAGNRIAWMRPRYNAVLTGLGLAANDGANSGANADGVSDSVSEKSPEN